MFCFPIINVLYLLSTNTYKLYKHLKTVHLINNKGVALHLVVSIQPFPYQGSKRKIADQILNKLSIKPKRIIEPFAGSAAITVAAAIKEISNSFIINDSYKPLAQLWDLIIYNPSSVIAGYTKLWNEQLSDPKTYYLKIRKEFNHDNDPIKLLYLINRAVKGAVRFNASGEFNQSPDNRRLGKKPVRVMKDLNIISTMLQGKTQVLNYDYSKILNQATTDDFIYMDPPYLGTSVGNNHRYHKNLNLNRFVKNIEVLNKRHINYMISFDGHTGNKTYGEDLPLYLGLQKININAGLSAQGTLNGKRIYTTESLYIHLINE